MPRHYLSSISRSDESYESASSTESERDPLFLGDVTSSPLAEANENSLLRKLGLSFFLFGMTNNVLYVIILSAALDLVPPSTPKGIIAFCNIAPALVAKVGWPYFLKGRIRYSQRLVGCCLLSAFGMVIVALFDSLFVRLLGIGIASFSSGLGELTFLQLSTTYSPPSVAGRSVGYFASGTGAAGLVGASLWWCVRSLGVRTGVGLSAILPVIIPATFYLLLPRPASFLGLALPEEYQDELSGNPLTVPYTPLATSADCDGEEEGSLAAGPKGGFSLTMSDKWRLVQPLLLRYMLPLFCVYLFEYTINQGIAPTLLYPVPSREHHFILGRIIKSIRDYYPLWQLVYQTNVFLSRSSLSLGISPIPARFLSLPAIVQSFVLVILAYESAVGFFPVEKEGISITFVFCMISLEGICGGLAYVNSFYRLNQEQPSVETAHDLERTKQEREFKIGSVGMADSFGILLASMLAVPAEIELCRAQVRRGKALCKTL